MSLNGGAVEKKMPENPRIGKKESETQKPVELRGQNGRNCSDIERNKTKYVYELSESGKTNLYVVICDKIKFAKCLKSILLLLCIVVNYNFNKIFMLKYKNIIDFCEILYYLCT